MRIGEVFEEALKLSDGDPFKATGLLGATTIWDRWNAESLSADNKGSRNDYSVLPKLMAGIGEGDITGQIYHFWGFVALIMGNGPEMGLLMGQTTTVGYELVRSWLQGRASDMEDYDIDNRAMGFGVGMYMTILNPPKDVEAAKALHKKHQCDAKPHQFVEQRKDFSRSCSVWLGNASSKVEALKQKDTLLASKPHSFLHFQDFFQCTVTAKQAPSQYSFVKLADGKKPNFAIFVYAQGTKDEKFGVMSSDWIGNGIGSMSRSGEVTDYCNAANKIGGDCGGLRQTISLDKCQHQATYRTCIEKRSDTIEYHMALNQHCLSSQPDKCVQVQDDEITRGCFLANKAGGTCFAMREQCIDFYCNRSSADFIQCKVDHKQTLDQCVAEHQHCLSAELDKCVPLKNLSTMMTAPMQ